MDNNQFNKPSALRPQAYANYTDDEIDLRELFGVLWSAKWLIAGVVVAAAIASLIYSLMLTNIYRAEAVLAPADEQQSNNMNSQLGGAAALLGVNLGAGGGDKVTTAIAVMKSREFIGQFIDEHKLLVPLFAGKWNAEDASSVVDQEIYNNINGTWVQEGGEPSRLEAYRKFLEILSVSSPDNETGLVTVSINWHDPVLASAWVNQLVADINRDSKVRDVAEATNAIEYLRNQLGATQLVEMQRVFYQLIESQTRITMLADVRNEYVFRIIDPAVVPDQKVAPRRKMICIFGTMLGGFFVVLFVIIRSYFFRDAD
ncbi:Wzz/FepE/Etk N-terminal domain-containing protein [Desulfosediminicola sp.]|uniref:Wzz/FepE/Etk N-terminal domain-containing protein n=1 Tax=Desulfosediminicola sp. TaxID=2886825 RepID=UPI003AF2FF03